MYVPHFTLLFGLSAMVLPPNLADNRCSTVRILKASMNQDILETFFATLRLIGGPNDHPCSLDIKYKLKCHLLSKYSSDMLSHNVPTIDNVNNSCFKEIEKKS